VSPEVRENLTKAEEELEQTRADIKLVEKENLHFTVKFLGEIPDSAIGEVDARVGTLALRKMEVDVRGLGVFPDVRRPRVIWAGVAPHDLDAVTSSGQRVIDALEGVGESDGRAFHPHITLARVRSPRNHDALVAVLRDYSTRGFGRTPITALKLKSSSLTPSGPVYRDVREYALQ
jgi:2'-5' RNA ligase